MKVLFVTCFFIAKVFIVFAEHRSDANESEIKNLVKIKFDNIDISTIERTQEAERKGDPGYYYNKSDWFNFGGHHGYTRPGYSGRIVNRLQNQVNRPFKHYGPPNQQGPAYDQELNKSIPSEAILNQDIPSHIRDTDFVEESPIASQNNQPFGQHTANYLPPKNQKLPASNAPQLFSNQNHDFPGGPQQFPSQQQSQQLQLDNQNSLGQDFSVINPNFIQNDFQHQQISDATIFLSQNAEAISNLYGAPAPNENYAPHNQELKQINFNQQPSQHNSQNQNFQASQIDQSLRFQGPLPSYASGLLNTQETLEKIQSLEKDRIIAHLQQALLNRKSTARHNQNINDYAQSDKLQVTSQISSINKQSISQQIPFLPTSTESSAGYQGFYAPSRSVTTTTLPPVSSSTTSTTSTIHSPNHSFSGSDNTQIETKLPAPNSLKPTTLNPGFPQYTGFVPTFVSAGFVPSGATYATTLITPSSLKPADNSPTHFGIPIPTSQGHNPPNTTLVAMKPSNIPSHPNTPTFSITLGSVPTFLQPPLVKPKPVPVHPTYGLHPTLVNPSFVYKPVKVFPIYYYPNIGYQSIHKPLTPAPTHPWSYAPSFAQIKPSSIWK